MNEKINLMHTALRNVNGGTFTISINSSTGFDDTREIELTRQQMLGLIKDESGIYEAFDDLDVASYDIDDLEEEVNEIVEEVSFPEGMISIYPDEQMPTRMQPLLEELDKVAPGDAAAVKAVRDKVAALEGGEYEFALRICDGSGDYQYETCKENITLTAEQARGMLLAETRHKEILEGLVDTPFSAFEACNLLDKDDFKECVTIEAWGDYEELNDYIQSWVKILEAIDEGEITDEEELDEALDEMNPW